MQETVNHISAHVFAGSSVSAIGATILLAFGHPWVMRFTPGPAGGGIPPGFFAGLAAPAASGMLAQGGAALIAGLVGRHIATPSWRLLRHGAMRLSLVA